jgi:serine protein kinase
VALEDILERIKQQEQRLSWEGTFAEYFDKAVKNPNLAQLSHARIHDMLVAVGETVGRLGHKQCALFSGELFGLEKALSQTVEYFGAAGRGLATRKRILLLMGPPASGKTTLANLIKSGLEKYTRTDEGALYAIKGCPMQEEPLHLIPHEFREEVAQKYNLYIEGDLCPHCRWMLRETYGGNIDQVRVRRVVLSEQMGIGIGTFVATDPGSQDLTRLTGSLEPGAISDDRLETFGKAFRLNGELNVANRGLMEFIEIFKLDERFLAVLLVLTEEHKIKASGYGTIYADEAIIAHTNEAEYETLVKDPKTAALQDRVVVVRVPYNLRVSEETQIYKKLMSEVDLKGTHIAPLTLQVASIFAVLSRLQPSERIGMSLVKKMRLYDGQYVERFTAKDVEELQAESPREGMMGISPRFVINQIARAVSRPDVECLDPIDLLQTLWEGVEQSSSLAHEERKRLYNLFLETRRAYDEMAKLELQKAFVDGFDQAATGMVQEYVDHVNAYVANPDGHGNVIGQPHDPGIKFMESLESALGLQDYDRPDFRHEIHARADSLISAGVPIDYRMDSRLETAIVRRLGPNLRNVTRMLGPREELPPDLQTKREEVVQRLVRERGYHMQCAERLLDHVAQVMNTAPHNDNSLPKALRWLHG